MKRELIEKMLDGIDDKFIAEAKIAEDDKKLKDKKSFGARKTAVAATICIAVMGAGLSVVAATSDVFQSWLTQTFFGHKITKVELEKQNDDKADFPLDEKNHLSLQDDMDIGGVKESFVYQYHRKGDEEIVDQVYSVQNNGLKKLQAKSFRGDYDGVAFSFEYVIINQEIFGYNLKGDINKVFHFVDGDIVYADLGETKGDTFIKGCIARIDLKNGSVTKLTNDKTIGNMIMSPGGKMILINYRSKGYWMAFDIASQTEKKIREINGYAHSEEITFHDDYHIITLGDTYMDGDVELTGTKLIDLRSGEVQAAYKECGDISPEWVYKQDGNKRIIQNVNGETAIVIENVKGDPQPISSKGDYILLRDWDEKDTPFYLCNLAKESYMEIDVPSGLKDDVEIYLAAKENKILLTDGREAYLVDAGS